MNKEIKKLFVENKLLAGVVCALFLIFIISSLFFPGAAALMVLVILGVLITFVVGIVMFVFKNSIGRRILMSSVVLVALIIMLNFAYSGVLSSRKKFITNESRSDSFKRVIFDIERYKQETGAYPANADTLNKKYQTQLPSKKCFLGMCTKTDYFIGGNSYILLISSSQMTPFIFYGCDIRFSVIMTGEKYDIYKNNLDSILYAKEGRSCL